MGPRGSGSAVFGSIPVRILLLVLLLYVNGSMVFRIQNPVTGEMWGLSALTAGTHIQLGAAGAVDNQKWVVELAN